MAFSDLRDFMHTVEEADKVRVIDGADWNLEIGTLTELLCHGAESPMLVFDNIPGYPAGYRVASNVLGSPRRFAIAAGVSMKARGLDLVRAWREKVKDGFKPLTTEEEQKNTSQLNWDLLWGLRVFLVLPL